MRVATSLTIGTALAGANVEISLGDARESNAETSVTGVDCEEDPVYLELTRLEIPRLGEEKDNKRAIPVAEICLG